MNNQKRVRLTVCGHVQGVGFRYYARREGERLGIIGWIKNLPDGNVEAEAQGNEKSVDAFITAMHRGPSAARVVGVQVWEMPLNDRGDDFEIRMF